MLALALNAVWLPSGIGRGDVTDAAIALLRTATAQRRSPSRLAVHFVGARRDQVNLNPSVAGVWDSRGDDRHRLWNGLEEGGEREGCRCC